MLNRKCASALDRGVHFYPGELDWQKIREALPYFVGEKDFKAFQGAKSVVKTSVRKIKRFDLTQLSSELFVFEVEGNGFLKQMVRNMVGTVLEIGEGRMLPSAIEEIIASRDRRRAGRTAPPRGLYLAQVVYPERYGLN